MRIENDIMYLDGFPYEPVVTEVVKLTQFIKLPPGRKVAKITYLSTYGDVRRELPPEFYQVNDEAVYPAGGLQFFPSVIYERGAVEIHLVKAEAGHEAAVAQPAQ